jgi:hypothetical protein
MWRILQHDEATILFLATNEAHYPQLLDVVWPR